MPWPGGQKECSPTMPVNRRAASQRKGPRWPSGPVIGRELCVVMNKKQWRKMGLESSSLESSNAGSAHLCETREVSSSIRPLRFIISRRRIRATFSFWGGGEVDIRLWIQRPELGAQCIARTSTPYVNGFLCFSPSLISFGTDDTGCNF